MPRALWNGAVIAKSDDVEVVDGFSYFPADAVDHRYLQPSDHRSVCPWKGTARYFDIVVDGEVNTASAWDYPEPSPRAAQRVGGRVGFWRGVTIEPELPADAPSRRSVLRRIADRLS